MSSHSKDDFKALISAFGNKSARMEELSYEATQMIVDLRENEDLAHQEVKQRSKEIFDATYYRSKNAPIQVQDLPEEIDMENFRQKLDESKTAKLVSKKHDEAIQQQINEKKEQIAKMEESIQRKLETIDAAKQLLA